MRAVGRIQIDPSCPAIAILQGGRGIHLSRACNARLQLARARNDWGGRIGSGSVRSSNRPLPKCERGKRCRFPLAASFRFNSEILTSWSPSDRGVPSIAWPLAGDQGAVAQLRDGSSLLNSRSAAGCRQAAGSKPQGRQDNGRSGLRPRCAGCNWRYLASRLRHDERDETSPRLIAACWGG